MGRDGEGKERVGFRELKERGREGEREREKEKRKKGERDKGIQTI